jgi:hypothetical protein
LETFRAGLTIFYLALGTATMIAAATVVVKRDVQFPVQGS